MRCLRRRDGESRRRSDRFLDGFKLFAPDIGVIVQVGERAAGPPPPGGGDVIAGMTSHGALTRGARRVVRGVS